MSDAIQALQIRLAELRQTFDGTFVAPPPTAPDEPEDLLAIDLAKAPFALRVRELHGLYVDRPITPLPSAPPELLGLAALRGELAAVYDLAALIGRAPADRPRFLVLGAAPGLAFAFAALHGHLRAAPAAFSRIRDGGPFCEDLVHDGERTRPVLALGSVTGILEHRVRSAAPKEATE